jgi:hypothetical protein
LALAKRLRPNNPLGPSENISNQGMNRTFIHPFVGPAMLWSPFSSSRDIGCINAGYPIRYAL